jgi:hypothetical protein
MLAIILALAATAAPATEISTTLWGARTISIAERDLPEDVDIPADASAATIAKLSDYSTCRSGCQQVGLRFGKDHDTVTFTSGADGQVRTSYVAAIDETPNSEGVLLVDESGDPRTSDNAIRFPLDGTRKWVIRNAKTDDGGTVRRLTVVWAEGLPAGETR